MLSHKLQGIQFLLSQLHNQFVGGGLILMVTGSVFALARKVPDQFGKWVQRRCTVDVEILNSDPLFDYVTFWLNSQPYSRRARKLTATTSSHIASEDTDDNTPAPTNSEAAKLSQILLSPAPGKHFFTYKHRLLCLTRIRDPAAQGTGDSRSKLLKHETYRITLLGRNQVLIRELMDSIVAFGARPQRTIKLFFPAYGYWQNPINRLPRSLDSVVLPPGVSERILNDASTFLASRERYCSFGIPWHRGYLLHGVPGSGKTSLVTALAGVLRLNLYLLILSGIGMDDDRISALFAAVRPGSIILLEDADCTFPDRRQTDSRGITLSGLLNCLDGLQSREGCLVFMTTNHPEQLDSALLRPGRVDVQIEFGLATEDQILTLRERLAPALDPQIALSLCTGKSMAEVQQVFLALKMAQ